MGPDPIWVGSLEDEKIWTQKDTAGVCMHREKTTGEHSNEEPIYKPRNEVSEELKPANTLILDC